ncbi:SusD/RagB family nutrient-binding outer membrane lipoprotein [Cyclobacterium sp. 1_MG-2023]|uniref:SusD/RagB family nutrient-binding outer membrane lipoprotein n=1 Tax=Cyclobacterium sp. 1_MG-2023 TaxID=3062681 RepID=UPI0026E11933|nr:SusD/RagB family nutrient-binding outer membrane lipoprotein [Cyclobacterium sp. 1_MG-2023]MDO6435899.1 SusD/RagB family nutrient-binding outer membrane lipoprotein [Cyclobacterium sp. 1_MG-2023]
MKKSKKSYIYPVILLFLLFSCDSGFDEMNTNPVRLTSIDPTFQLNQAIITSSPGYNNLTYEVTIVRQMITPFQGVGTGGNLNQDNRAATQGNWYTYYQTIIKNLVDGLSALEDMPDRTNLEHILKIWKAHAFLVLTDTYGDIPYTEAGKGYIDGVVFPKYDSQESIYNAILNDLEAAVQGLDASKDDIGQEVMYSGNIIQWKRLGNSLLLRAGMRLSKVDPSAAASYASKAVAGGLMQSNDDNAVVRHNADYRNGVGTNLNGGQAPFYYLDKEFVDFFKANEDPRLTSIGVRYIGALSGNDQVEANAVRAFDAQIGMPQGYDNTTIIPVVEDEGLASLFDYSQLDRSRMGNPEAPNFLVTYSQTLLLWAEAAYRGWAPGDPEELYHAGIRAHMEQMALWGNNVAIPSDEIDAYIANHPLEVGKELELINTQYWVSSFLIGHEAWSNFRRSGYPILTPNPYPGSDLKEEDFIRRLTYPDAELTVNKDNIDVATSRMGPDILDTRVWWDVEQ